MRNVVAQACVACGGSERAHVLDLDRFRIDRCAGCGMHTLSPAPGEVQLEGFNDGTEYEAAFTFREQIMARHGRSLAGVERFVQPGRLLDVGCGPGMLLEVARARGWDAEGVDPSPWAVERARALGFTAHVGMLEEVSLQQASFDAIALLQVVEHMTDPRPLLASCRSLLRLGGALLVATPNPTSWLARATRERFNYWIPPVHCAWYTPRALATVLHAAGFHPVRESTWSARAAGLHDGLAMLDSSRVTARLPMRVKTKLADVVAAAADRLKRGTIVEQIAVKREDA